MQLEMTFDDPKTYRKPFTIKVPVSFVPDDDLIENVCLENEKDRRRLVGTISDERKTEKKIPVSVLGQYEGTYDVGPLGNWKVAIVGDNLTVDLGTGGGKQDIFA